MRVKEELVNVKDPDYENAINRGAGLVEYSTFLTDSQEPFIILYEDAENPRASIIRGTLKQNPELKPFGINQNKFFSNKELERLVKMSSHLFPDLKTAKDLIKNLQNFQVKFTTLIEKKDDRAGNTKDLIESAIEVSAGAIQKVWKLRAPLFVGGPAEEFEVEIEIEKRGDSASMGFFSLEYSKLVKERGEQMIADELAAIPEHYPKIQLIS